MKTKLTLIICMLFLGCAAQKERSNVLEKSTSTISIKKVEKNDKLKELFDEFYKHNYEVQYKFFSQFLDVVQSSQYNDSYLRSEISKLKDSITILRLDIKGLLTQNDIQADAIRKNIEELKYQRRLDSMKIAVLENKYDIVQTFIKDSVQFICTQPVVDSNLIGDLDYIHGGWYVMDDNSYYYDSSSGDFRYIRWLLDENLKVNDIYTISFKIEVEDTALLNFWAYVDEEQNDGSVSNPSITSNTYYESGYYEFDYIVSNIERNKFAIRAKDLSSFTISEISVTKKR